MAEAGRALFHVAGWRESIDPAAALENIAALADSLMTVNGDDLVVNAKYPYVGGVYAATAAASLLRACITGPSLDPIPFEVQPISATVEPGSPPAHMSFFEHPLKFPENEKLNAQYNSDPAAAEDHAVLAWFTQGPIRPQAPPANARWVRFTTAASAGTAWSWAGFTRSITPIRNLPTKRYKVFGLRAQTTTGVAARIAFPDYVGKPGCLISDAVTDNVAEYQRLMTHLGSWGEFGSENLPSIEFLTTAADNEVQEVDLLIAS